MVYDLFKSKFSIFSFQNAVFCNSFSHIFSKFKCLGPEGGLLKNVHGISGPLAMLISLLCSSCFFLKKLCVENLIKRLWSREVNKICQKSVNVAKQRSTYPKVFYEKGVLKTFSKFTGEHPCRSVISINSLCHFVMGILL